MATMQACAQALADTLAAHSQWPADRAETKVYAYPVLDPKVSCVVLEPTRWPVLSFGRGAVEFGFNVLAISGNQRDEGAHEELMAAITPFGSSSLVAAVYAHPTLGTSTTESITDAATTMTASVDTGGEQLYGRRSFSDGGPPFFWFVAFGVTILTRGTA